MFYRHHQQPTSVHCRAKTSPIAFQTHLPRAVRIPSLNSNVPISPCLPVTGLLDTFLGIHYVTLAVHHLRSCLTTLSGKFHGFYFNWRMTSWHHLLKFVAWSRKLFFPPQVFLPIILRPMARWADVSLFSSCLARSQDRPLNTIRVCSDWLYMFILSGSSSSHFIIWECFLNAP